MSRREPVVGGKAWQRQQRVWRHNSFSGHAAMMQAQLRGIINSDSITSEARTIACKIDLLIPGLKAALKTRIDP